MVFNGSMKEKEKITFSTFIKQCYTGKDGVEGIFYS